MSEKIPSISKSEVDVEVVSATGQEITEGLYETVDFFESHKYDDSLQEKFVELTGVDPRNFFTDETLSKLTSLDQGERLVLLAKSAMFITTNSDDVNRYLDYFPKDVEVLEEVAFRYADRPSDSATFVLLSTVADRFTASHSNKQLLEIEKRRQLAPDFLLDGYEYNMGTSRIEEDFGDASVGYIDASREANELSFAGSKPFNNSSPFSSPEFEALDEADKSHMLRICLGSQQLTLVFEEAFNSAFTEDSVSRMNQRMQNNAESEFKTNPYNVAHSMLYGTLQGNSSYEIPQARFEREMNSTAETGGYVEEYAEHKLTLATIEAFTKREPNPENVSLLVDFWNKNRNPIFGNIIAEALTVQGSEQAAQELMELIKSDTRNKNALASVLYRLELGRIGMSEEGVKYMGRLYNLGEFNNPDFFVNRLTAEGQIGVFDDEEKMVGYFGLGDMTGEQTQVSTEVMSVTYETLFKNHGEISEEEREKREFFIQEFTEKYFSLYNENFYKETGVRVNNLTFEEQGWFLSFVSEADVDNQEKLYQFVRKFGEEGMRAFLSMEFDRSIGTHIVEDIGSSDKAGEILGLYNHLLLATRSTIEQLGDSVSKEVKNSLETSLMKKAKDILAGDINDEEAMQKLEQVRVDNFVFVSAFRSLRMEGIIDDEEDLKILDGASFESVEASKLTPADKKQMFNIFDKNWSGESEEFSSKVKYGLEASLTSPVTSFSLLRHRMLLILICTSVPSM